MCSSLAEVPPAFRAAVAAARNGADVLLLERFSYLGGLATGGLIILLLTMDDGAGKQAIGGLCQEIVDRMEKRSAVYYPPESEWNNPDSKLVQHYNRWGLVWGGGPHRVRYSVAFEPHEFIFAADQMLQEAGVRTSIPDVGLRADRRGRLDHAPSSSRTRRAGRRSKPKVVIDATGDGDIFAAAGEPYELERVHPWLWFLMSNVKDVEASFEAGKGSTSTRPAATGCLCPWGGEGRVNRKIDATDPIEVSEALVECRKMVMEEAARLRSAVPGFAEATISLMADQLGITESRRLQGEYVIARDDLDKRVR